MTLAETRLRLRNGWQRLAPRERRIVIAAAALVSLALLWWLLLAPALATLRTADAQHRALDTQLQQMLAWREQALRMQAQPRQNREDAIRLLEGSIRGGLGAGAKMVTAGERVTVTMSAVPPDALAQWLTQARINARAVPAEARLQRNAAGQWDGTLVLNLPAR
jgi:general secretion pathway protein M